MSCKEAWFTAAVLVATLGPSVPAIAQEGFFEALVRKSSEALGQESGVRSQGSGVRVTDADVQVADTRRLTLVTGQTRTITLPEPIAQIKVDNPAMVGVKPTSPTEFLVTAKSAKPGTARVLVLDKKGQWHRIDVTITLDAGPLQQALFELYPDTNVRVISAGDSGVAVVGNVDNPQSISPILELAEKFYPGGVINGLKAVGPQQVQLRVMIAEVSRTKMRALGYNFLSFGHRDYFTSTVGGLLTINSFTGVSPNFTFSPDNTFTYGRINNGKVFRGFIRALKEEGLAKIIAEPTLVAFSGRAATMNVGGEFPIIVPGQQGTFTVEFRDYGNKLDFVPIVLGGGRIRLEVRPELSELDYSNGVIMAGFTIPGIKQRRLDTAVELNTGESFVIGGLLTTTDTANTSKVPYIGDLAIIGAAFRTVTYSQEEKELVVMVTPELVEPLGPGQKPCAYPGSEASPPRDHELYWLGNVEAPVCNASEIARRAELNLPVNHAQTKSIEDRGSRIEDRGSSTEDKPQSSILRPSNPGAPGPGLIGPLGYNAGR